MSDETIPEARPAAGALPVDAPDGGGPTPSIPPAETGQPEAGSGPADRAVGAASHPDGEAAARKRRRRGSRGGRNRRKQSASTPSPRVGGGEGPRGAGSDRLTTEDLAAEALEDAGLRAQPAGDPRPAPAHRPKIGDTRPAPSTATAEDPASGDATSGGGSGGATGTDSRRRRRGGRGRGRSRSVAAPAKAVEADLGLDDAPGFDELDDDVLERRRGRTRKGRPAGRYLMCVRVHPNGATHIAVLEGRALVEHSVSRPEDDDLSIDGNIYLGKVQNVLPGMEAAFVDIGTPKNGVLYRGDVAYDESEVEEKQPKIERLLKNGQSVTVQVTKNPIGAKGARLTQEVSLAGRFVVMVPNQPDTYGISKRLPDDERRRLRRVLDGLRPPDAGLIVRTAAEGATADELARDMRRLQSQWQQIAALAARSKPATLLYKEPALVVRVIREEFTKEYRGVVIDDRVLYEEVRAYVDAIAPELADRIEYYDEAEEHLPIFERFHVHEQLHKALDRKVWLPSGGSLIVERTEALTVIDVNTGKNVGKSNLEETVFKNNLEAAEEAARQLRLRDIGGIIVIDFIDMEIKKNREEVLRAFKDALARDKTRTQVFEISELGLVEMTRKRISEGLVEAFSETCPTCNGRGFTVDESMLI
jgi:ribonuclease E